MFEELEECEWDMAVGAGGDRDGGGGGRVEDGDGEEGEEEGGQEEEEGVVWSRGGHDHGGVFFPPSLSSVCVARNVVPVYAGQETDRASPKVGG